MQLTDIFGNDVNVGDKVAVGMSYDRSSVLRVGEVISVKEAKPPYYMTNRPDYCKWAIRIKWTHDGSDGTGWGSVKDSTIYHESSHTFAKLLVLPSDFVAANPRKAHTP